jgi:CubicO group peptidase (beta-lactamase class C family)
VLADDHVVVAADGVLNARTRQRATPDAKFQIGSTTKTFVATMVMQLVAAGLVGLDDPVERVVGDLQFGADEQARRVTVRQLLTHTSGVFGDFYGDFGRGDDALARYVEACATLPQVVPPGSAVSYCNSGFIVLGRMIEVLTGTPFNTALRTRVLAPVGAQESATVPEEAILGRVAVGHLPTPPSTRARMVTPQWALPDSMTPAGALLSMSAGDLLRWGRLHLDRGSGPAGAAVISPETVAAMCEAQVRLPSPATRHVTAWGLGWMLFDLAGVAAFGHDGAALGQSSFLRIVPDAGLVVALIVNGPAGDALFDDLFTAILGEVAAISLAAPRGASAPRPDALDVAVGTFRQPHLEITLRRDGDEVVADFVPQAGVTGVSVAAPPTLGVPARIVDSDPQTIELVVDLAGATTPITLSGFRGDGRAGVLHTGFRAFPRVE